MGFLKELQPHVASAVLVLGFAAAAVVLLVAGCAKSPWFVVAHATLAIIACAAWASATVTTPEALRLSRPTAEVWGNFVAAHNWIATAEFSSLGFYGLLLAAACSIRCATYPEVFLLHAHSSVLLGGAINIPSVLLVVTVAIMILLSWCTSQGEPFFSTSSQALPSFMANLPSDQASRFAPAIVRYGLTAREADVLPLLASGLPAASIAAKLCVSTPTVNSHAQHIYAKVGVHGREELVAKLGVGGERGRGQLG